MSLIDALSGVLHVRPGRPRPHNIEGSRPDWAETLTRGRPLGAVPAMLGSAYSLCGHAHRLCAELALQAASGRVAPVGTDARRLLQLETLREHVRRIGLDWVRQLASGPGQADLAAESEAGLRVCPALVGPGQDVPAARTWLEQHWLAMPADAWLHRWERDGGAWLTDWSAAAPGWLPRLLVSVQHAAETPIVPAAPLHVHARPDALLALAEPLRHDAGLTRRPRWNGACAESGTWTRLHEAGQAPPGPHTPWLRLGARLAELVRLTLPDAPARSGRHWLAMGALHLGAGEGLAWVEMARGLLVHYVQVEPSRLEPCVARYRVLAPTEWNFHPEGAVAQALEDLTGDDVPARVATLMAAYDPCVRFEVERRTITREAARA